MIKIFLILILLSLFSLLVVLLIKEVKEITPEVMALAGGAGSSLGTGGMATKLIAAKIATWSGADMVIANSDHVSVIEEILNAEEKRTVFPAHKKEDFDVVKFIS